MQMLEQSDIHSCGLISNQAVFALTPASRGKEVETPLLRSDRTSTGGLEQLGI